MKIETLERANRINEDINNINKELSRINRAKEYSCIFSDRITDYRVILSDQEKNMFIEILKANRNAELERLNRELEKL